MAAADLDYSPLARRVGLRKRLRAVAANPLTLIGGTVVVLMTVLATALGVGLLVYDDDPDGGLVFVSLLFAGAGALALLGQLGKAGDGHALDRFAEVNGLQALHGSPASLYAGRRFADGSYVVHVGVRTPGEAFCEVGDCQEVSSVRFEDDHRSPTLYLRVRTVGFLPAGQDAAAVLGPVLLDALTDLAGSTTVELAPREVTVIGSRGLGPASPARVREVLELAERVAMRAEAVARPARRGRAGRSTPSGVPIPLPPPQEPSWGGRLRPVTIVLGTLVVMVVVPLGIAVLMSNLEPQLRGRALAAGVVVSLLLVGVSALVTGLVRVAVTHRDGRDRRRAR